MSSGEIVQAKSTEMKPTNRAVAMALANGERLRLAAIVAQLVLITMLALMVNLEGQPGTISSFGKVLLLATAGFVVQQVLPQALRLPFFAILSFLGIGVVFGLKQTDAGVAVDTQGVLTGLCLVGIGLILIGICHLPVSFGARVGMLAAAGVLLVAARAGWLGLQPISAMWPILGSMFMFRLIVYMYELKHKSAPFDFWRACAYFFMLPNVCFPLFPVVDYKTFCRTYCNDDPIRGYQIGVRWIFRGVVQLLLYRLVYGVLQISPDEVVGIGTLMRYMLGVYLLYLYVSGSFHIIVGILRLFGFNLPETHHLYLLSSSFTDFWRRINIYWKDFIMKIVFYPMYFRLKRIGHLKAMVLATAIAFVATWILHAYQWFWILGNWHSPAQDVLFWAILGALVIVNTLWESTWGRQRTLKSDDQRTPRQLAVQAASTVLTFVAILFLWSFWTSDSVEQWTDMIRNGAHFSWSGALFIAGVLSCITLGAVMLGQRQREWTDSGRRANQGESPLVFWRSAATIGLSCVMLILVTRARVYSHFGTDLAAIAQSVRALDRNALDQTDMQRGYYEDLTNVSRTNPALGSGVPQPPPDWIRIEQSAAAEPTNDFMRWRLKPLVTTEFKREEFSTNRWAMRDRDYSKSKADDSYRIAMVGESITMGSGVANQETYENLLEDRLNKTESPTDTDNPKYEVLNFGVAGYGPMRRLVELEHRVFEFEPDAVILAATPLDFDMIVWDLSHALRNDIEIPYPKVTELVRQAGAGRGVPRVVLERRLKALNHELLQWCFAEFAATCRKREVEAYVVALPLVDRRPDSDLGSIVQLAENAGLTVLSLAAAYPTGTDRKKLELAPWDTHPNRAGHRLLADELFRALTEQRLFSASSAETAGVPLESLN